MNPGILRRSKPRPGGRPALRAAIATAPVVVGAALLAGWLWSSRRRAGSHAGDQWLRKLVMSLEVDSARHEVLAFIRDTLVGIDKKNVRKLLGQPAAAGDDGMVFEEPAAARQELADCWYYRLNAAAPGEEDAGAALVVEFDPQDRASDARFLIPAARRQR